MSELFEFFDPEAEVEITYRHLPHWEQQGKTYFITFRTADSIPADVMELWYCQRDDWLRRHGIDPSHGDWQACFEKLDWRLQQQFHRTFANRFHRYLDDCHGECVLKRPELARIVADSLLYFDGNRYHMGDFIVMPNHVHLLVGFIGSTKMKKQCKSWKHYTAVQINRALGRKGHFWQDESFDHLVRSPERF